VSAGGVQIVRVVAALPEGFDDLRRQASAEGYGFLDRLAEDVSRGDYAGEANLPVLFATFSGGDLAAVGGLTADPYDPAPDLARLRHVYVAPAFRGSGVGRSLASAVIQQGFALAGRLSLRAADERAAAFWEAAGFFRDVSGMERTHILAR
jgi:GNAT superfamily N-acetyltransferase